MRILTLQVVLEGAAPLVVSELEEVAQVEVVIETALTARSQVTCPRIALSLRGRGASEEDSEGAVVEALLERIIEAVVETWAEAVVVVPGWITPGASLSMIVGLDGAPVRTRVALPRWILLRGVNRVILPWVHLLQLGEQLILFISQSLGVAGETVLQLLAWTLR